MGKNDLERIFLMTPNALIIIITVAKSKKKRLLLLANDVSITFGVTHKKFKLEEIPIK